MRIRKWKLDNGTSLALWPGGRKYTTDLRVFNQDGGFIGASANKRKLRAIANAIIEALDMETLDLDIWKEGD